MHMDLIAGAAVGSPVNPIANKYFGLPPPFKKR